MNAALNGAAAKIAAATTTAVTTIAATKAGIPTAVLRCMMTWFRKCLLLINTFVRIKFVLICPGMIGCACDLILQFSTVSPKE